jgi:hypothetical protein
VSATQVVTWRRYTQQDKWEYRARERRRRMKRRWLKEQVFAAIYNGQIPNEEYLRALGWDRGCLSTRSFL